jgi:hypothetical protein
VDTPNQYNTGDYVYGGTIINIRRLDNNDDWVTLPGGGRYKYRVDCNNCGTCWHTGYGDDDQCFMISEAWEKEQARERRAKKELERIQNNRIAF